MIFLANACLWCLQCQFLFMFFPFHYRIFPREEQHWAHSFYLVVQFWYVGFIHTTLPDLQGIVQKLTEQIYLCNQWWGENTSLAVGALTTAKCIFLLPNYTYFVLWLLFRGWNQFCFHGEMNFLLILPLDLWKYYTSDCTYIFACCRSIFPHTNNI